MGEIGWANGFGLILPSLVIDFIEGGIKFPLDLLLINFVNYILKSKWLPTPTTHNVISTLRDFDDFPMFSSLIDENSKWWKPDLVKSLFLHLEANEILKIPLSHNLPEDSLIWLGKKKGSFTVKSAYYVAKELVESGEAGESSSNHQVSPF